VHVSAVVKNPMAYEHIKPGTCRQSPARPGSDLAGKSNVEYKAKNWALDLAKDDALSKKIVHEVKLMEDPRLSV